MKGKRGISQPMYAAFFVHYFLINNQIICYFQVRIRSSILQQLKDLKALREDAVLTENEFSSQKEKLN